MKELTQSLEKYLLTVYELVEENSAARVRDVSEKIKIGAASTSEAIKTLAKRGYLNYQPYGIITITPKGKKAVEEKIQRHKTIENFLENVLMVDKQYAKEIEFSMPDEVLNRFVDYLTFMQKCSCKEPKWLKSFQEYTKENKMPERCSQCDGGCKICKCND